MKDPKIGGVTDPLTPRQVAALFNVTIGTVANWADEGRLPSFKTPGGHRRFRKADVVRFLDEQGSAA